ncbi:MAG: arsenate reductase/protein-tyrosine-phosphatase family protein [Acidimicrobiales bacterium]
MTEILVVCTANLCRSPMAARLLARHIGNRGGEADVWSVGTAATAGLLPPALVTEAMASCGIDMAGHRSKPLTASQVASADLVLTMTREHLRHVVVAMPDSWPRVFALKELVRRAGEIGARPEDEALEEWLARAHTDRNRSALLGESQADDVEDPIGGPPEAYAATAHELDLLTADISEALWPRVTRQEIG